LELISLSLLLVCLQVQNWNEGRIAKQRMKQQLLVVAGEMTENGNWLQNYIDNFGDIITDMVKFLGSTSSINRAAI